MRLLLTKRRDNFTAPYAAVGHVTLIEGEGKLVPGKGPVRTASRRFSRARAATGIPFSQHQGIRISRGTDSADRLAQRWDCARRRNSVQLKNGREFIFTYPIVAETFDFLNDANGEHVKPIHALQALDRAKPGPVEEGAVGGGTGMGCNGFKGGIGTSSRVLTTEQGGYTIGVLVQCNYGGDLRILGVPIRSEITDLGICTVLPPPQSDHGQPAFLRVPVQALRRATTMVLLNTKVVARS